MLRIYRLISPAMLASTLWLGVLVRRAEAGQGNTPDACTLLSQAEIEQTVGVAINSGERRLTIESASACRFTIKGGGLITVVVRRPSRPGWIKEQITRMVSYPQRFHEVNGIGDRSFLFDITQTSAALCIFRADHYIQVSASGLALSSKLLPVLVALGEKVLPRF